MLPRIASVKHLQEYKLQLEFTDGTAGALDFRSRLAGRRGVFQPLQSVDFFKQVAVDPEAGTIVWPNGVDFCPNVLYAEITGKSAADFTARSDVA
jgi:hypothetical protein